MSQNPLEMVLSAHLGLNTNTVTPLDAFDRFSKAKVSGKTFAICQCAFETIIMAFSFPKGREIAQQHAND